MQNSCRIDGDPPPDVVTALYTTHYARMLRLAALFVDDPLTYEDVVQEAYVRAWTARHRIRDTDAALAYLTKTIMNVGRSARRRRALAQRHREREGAADVVTGIGHPSAAEEAFVTFTHDALVSAIRSLPRRQREVLALRYLLDMTEVQAAEVLGISRGSIKAYTSRALAAMQPIMEEWRDGSK
jgi:RNA polymerase sigma-70 factor (sigma-E family)